MDSAETNTIVDDKASVATTDSDHEPAPPPSQHPTQDELSSRSKSIIVISLCCCTFLAALDQTIITTAIPILAAQFNSPSAYTWIGSAYLLGSATFLPSWGKFSDIWGRKPVILTAVGLFLLGSVLCAGAQSMGMMVAGRVIQGIGAGGMLGLVNVTISDIVSIRERGLYLSYVGMTWAIASAVGPVLGGVFTGMATWGWRFCFILNLPFGLLAVTGIVVFLHLQSPKISLQKGLKRVDWLGTFFILSGTVLFLLGLEFGGIHYPWSSATVVCFLILGFLLLCAFIIVEWRFAVLPLMPLRLFHHRTNICAYQVGFWHGFVFIAGCYFLPLYFQAVRGDTPLMSGVYVLPFVITLSIVSAISGVTVSKTGRYQELIWAGCALMTLGTGLLIDLDRTSSWAKLALYQIVAGAGCGPLFASPLIAVHSTVEPKDIGTATTTFAFLRTLGTAMAVSIGLVVFQNRMEMQADKMHAKLPAVMANAITGGSASASVEFVKTFPAELRHVAQDAFGQGTRAMWYLFLALSVLCLVFSAGIGRHHLSKQLNSSQPAMKRPKKKAPVDGQEAV